MKQLSIIMLITALVSACGGINQKAHGTIYCTQDLVYCKDGSVQGRDSSKGCSVSCEEAKIRRVKKSDNSSSENQE